MDSGRPSGSVSGSGSVSARAGAVLGRAGLGDHRVAGVSRLRGGSHKGVYRVACADGFSVIMYVWAAEENYWPAAPEGEATVFGRASGLDLFSACAARFEAAGVRIPRVYLLDASQTVYPADLALVEDVRGGTLEESLAADPVAARPVVGRLGAMLTSMREQRADHFGPVDGVSRSGESGRCEQVVLDRALRHLERAARRVPRIADARPQLAEMLRSLAAAVSPRTEYSLIHGELGPDHVLIDEQGHPVLIDIEGAMYFDAEWEHAFLRLRFGDEYGWLGAAGLDERRMRLYSLALYLSLIEGPLRLLDGDFPDRDGMRSIVDANIERALAMAGTAEH